MHEQVVITIELFVQRQHRPSRVTPFYMVPCSKQSVHDTVREKQGCLKAVITDVHMPRMSGFELAAVLRAEYPEVRILCMSGYPTLALASNYYLIAKPFTRTALLAIIDDVLAIRRVSPA